MDKVLLLDYYSALFAAFVFARQLHSPPHKNKINQK